MASSLIGALRVSMALDSAQFSKGVAAAKTSLGKLDASFAKFGNMAVTGFASVSAGLAAVSAAVIKVSGEVDKLGKTSAKLGLSTNGLQELRHAADLAGVPIATLETSMQRFARRVGEAAKGTGVLKDELKAQGVELKDSKGVMRPVIDIFKDYADAVQKAGSQQEKLRLLIKAFDTEGGKMFEMVKNGRTGINEAIQDFTKLGYYVGPKFTENSAAFQDNLTRINLWLDGLGKRIVDKVLPAFVSMSNSFVDFLRNSQALRVSVSIFAEIISGFIGSLRTLAATVYALAPPWEYVAVAAGSVFVAMSPAIIASITKAVAVLAAGITVLTVRLALLLLANPFGLLAAGIAAVAVTMYHFRDDFKNIFGVSLPTAIKAVANWLIGGFTGAFKIVIHTAKNAIAIVGGAVVSLVKSVVVGLLSIIDMAINGMVRLVEKIPKIVRDKIGLGDIARSDLAGAAAAYDPGGVIAAGAKPLKEIGEIVNEEMSKDHVGKFTNYIQKKLESAGEVSKRYADAIANSIDKITPGGKGGGKKEAKEKKDPYKVIIANGEKFIATQTRIRESLGLSALAAQKLKFEQDLLNKATAAGVIITKEKAAELAGLAQRMAENAVKTKEMKAAFDFAKSSVHGFITDLRTGLQQGKSFFKSFTDAALRLLDKIIAKIETELVNALFNLPSAGAGGGGGFLGAVVKGVVGFFGGGGGGGGDFSMYGHYAQGGQFKVGGSGGIDSQTVAFKASPNETVTVAKPGQTFGSRGGGAQVNVYAPPGSNVKTERRKGAGGIDVVDVILSEVKAAMGKGEFDNTFSGRYAMKPSLVRR